MEISIDASEFRRLASDLRREGATLPQKVRSVVQKGALNVKNGQNADLDASGSFSQVRSSFDTKFGRDFAEAEIGPKTSGQVVGDLYHIAVFGGSPAGGGSVRDPQEVLDEEGPRFENAMLELVDGLLS